jgi:hypothetical protein
MINITHSFRLIERKDYARGGIWHALGMKQVARAVQGTKEGI